MPIFQYEPYRNPYGPSIAEALQEGGRIEAAGALRAGEIQADAARRNAALTGNMWATAANAVTAIPQQMRENRELALREQQQRQQMALSTMALEDKTRQREADVQLGKLFAETPRRDDGTYDVSAFLGKVPPEYAPHAQRWLAFSSDFNESVGKDNAKRHGEFQQAAASLIQAGSPFQAVQGVIDIGERDRVLTPQQAAAARQQLFEGGDPERVLRGFIAPRKPIEHDPTKALVDDLTGKVIVPSAPKPADFKQAQDVEGPNGEPLAFNPATGWFQTAEGTIVKNPQTKKPVETPAQIETRRHNEAVEAISQLTAGRAAAAQEETVRHNQAMEAASLGKKTSRPVLSSDTNRITDINTGIKEADALHTEIKGKTGTGSWIGANLPNIVTDVTGLGTESKQRQAVIDRVKQLIGKTLEGGVLRKEDEIKYEKILPTISDPPAVAATKLSGLREMLVRKRETTLESLSDAGFNVDAFTTRGAPAAGGAATAAPAGGVRILSITPVP